MRKMFRNFVIVALVFMMGGNVAFAAENEPADPTVTLTPAPYYSLNGNDGYYFDEVRYAAEYPEVAAVVGYDKASLWNHYVTTGIYECRNAWTTNSKTNAQIKMYQVVASEINDQMSDRDKVKAIHDWIINNTRYDHENYVMGTIPAVSYEIEGVMNNGVAVCAGYAKTFDAFMDIIGIPCDYVVGYANGGGHAWNRVFVDGQYLYVDTTWDDPVRSDGKDVLRYKYFLLPWYEMWNDHTEVELR